MDTVRLVIYVVFLIRKSTNEFQLSTSLSKATAGSSFSFTCTTDKQFISFTTSTQGTVYCTISGFKSNGECKVDSGCPKNNTYICDGSNPAKKTYTMTLPGYVVNDSLHGSNWTCLSTFGGDPSNKVNLYVNIPITKVTISTTPADTNTIEIVTGTDQLFKCTTVVGRPSSVIQWYISGTNITGSATSQPDICIAGCNGKVESSSILLYTGNRNDEGKNIYCTAQNSESGSVRSKNRTVSILYGPSIVSIVPTNETYTVPEYLGSVGPIVCTSGDCKPSCKIEWIGPKIPRNTASVLNLTRIDRTQAGTYKCNASNIASSETSISVIVIVEYGPNQVDIQPSTQAYNVTETTGSVGPITCTVDCEPSCAVTWSGPNLSYYDTSTLNVKNIDRSQAGSYICNATNIFGNTISAPVNVIVHYGPRHVNLFPATYYYIVNETTESVGPIICSADCKPDCSIIWSGSNLSNAASPILNLTNIDRNQAGNYLCTASNNFGSNKSVTVNIVVKYGPKQVNISPSTEIYIVTEIGSVNPITCSANCKPDCNVSWTGPNLPDGTTSVLNLQNIKRKQAGHYVCFASNYVGNGTSVKVNVTVQFGPDFVTLFPNTEYYTVNESSSSVFVECTSYCQPNCTMKWSGPNLPGDIRSILNLPSIDRSQTGEYRCTASNSIGNKTSLSVKITVNFRPVVHDLFGNKTYNENDTVVFSCKIESVPTAEIRWSFGDRNIERKNDLVSVNTSSQVSTLVIRRVGCLSMGMYNCTAGNIIGDDTKGKDIDVICSPRINELEYNVSTLITVKDHDPLNITAPLIAYPKPSIHWTFSTNETSENVTHQISNTFFKNRVFSNLYKENVTEADFGYYRIYAVNDIGKLNYYSHAFHVVPARKPNPPGNVTCSGSLNYVMVYWKSSFNGGDTQTFQIFIQEEAGADFYNYDQDYIDPGQKRYSEAKIKHLKPGTNYNFIVRASNKHNFTMSEPISCNTTSQGQNDQKITNTVAIGAGTGVGAGIIVIVIVTIVFVFKRRRENDEHRGQDKELIQRTVTKQEENEEDGLKENPLYVSSAQEDMGTVYSVVEKKEKNLNQDTNKLTDVNTIYTQVSKANKKGENKPAASKQKKSPNKDMKNKDIEMDLTHGKEDDVYANSEVNSRIGNQHVYKPNKNKDGLIYADLDLAPTMSKTRFIIRGLENRNNYAVIDLTKTAEPLSSDSDTDDDQTDKNTAKE